MLLCDICNKGYHTECLHMVNIPETFICRECRPRATSVGSATSPTKICIILLKSLTSGKVTCTVFTGF